MWQDHRNRSDLRLECVAGMSVSPKKRGTCSLCETMSAHFFHTKVETLVKKLGSWCMVSKMKLKFKINELLLTMLKGWVGSCWTRRIKRWKRAGNLPHTDVMSLSEKWECERRGAIWLLYCSCVAVELCVTNSALAATELKQTFFSLFLSTTTTTACLAAFTSVA